MTESLYLLLKKDLKALKNPEKALLEAHRLNREQWAEYGVILHENIEL